MMRDIINRLGPHEIIVLSIALVVLFLIFAAWMLGAIAAGLYANRLNRSSAYGFLALIVSPLPVFLLLFGLGPRVDEDDDHIRVACPFCAEDVRSQARVCPHCRGDLARAAERLRPR
jgi:hypothetical protein